jgi:hypothetical protein
MRIAAGPCAAKAEFPGKAGKGRKNRPKWLRIDGYLLISRTFPNVFTSAPRNQQFETAIPA